MQNTSCSFGICILMDKQVQAPQYPAPTRQSLFCQHLRTLIDPSQHPFATPVDTRPPHTPTTQAGWDLGTGWSEKHSDYRCANTSVFPLARLAGCCLLVATWNGRRTGPAA